jgi:hypothetical protein
MSRRVCVVGRLFGSYVQVCLWPLSGTRDEGVQCTQEFSILYAVCCVAVVRTCACLESLFLVHLSFFFLVLVFICVSIIQLHPPRFISHLLLHSSPVPLPRLDRPRGAGSWGALDGGSRGARRRPPAAGGQQAKLMDWTACWCWTRPACAEARSQGPGRR